MIGLLLSLNRFWQREPPGYRPGVTLDRLVLNLQPYVCERISLRQLQLRLPQGPVIDVNEQVQSLFLAHIVTHHFCLQGQTTLEEPVRLQITAGGWLRRRGIIYHSKTPDVESQKLITALHHYPQIADTLAQLDFRRMTLEAAAGHWRLSIEHFAASEVVSRVPATRRYLRLEREQRRLLLSSFLMIHQLMGQVTQ